MKELTDIQRDTLEYISGYIERHKYPPSFRDIAIYYNVKIKTIADRLLYMKKKKVLTWEPGLARTIKIIKEAADE